MESVIMNDKVKQALPYVAVLGISALAVYGIAKILRELKDLDATLASLDFNYEHQETDWDEHK
jgi:hypothetical protein